MAWIKVESSVARNRKFQKAGAAASWLWLCGLAYCQEGLTDGFIPVESIDYLGVKQARRLAELLVAADLWHAVVGGWDVHDYLEHNRAASEVRRLQHERKDAGAIGGKASGEARRKQTVEPVAEATREAKSKQPSNPSSSSATATATDQSGSERARARTPSIVSKRRLDAAWEGPRVYVPQRAHADFLALRRGAEPELLEWYAQVSEDWTLGAHAADEPGADMIVFWKARYAERWPATTTPKVSANRPAWGQVRS